MYNRLTRLTRLQCQPALESAKSTIIAQNQTSGVDFKAEPGTNPALPDTAPEALPIDPPRVTKIQAVEHWALKATWPQEYATQDLRTGQGLLRFISHSDFIFQEQMAEPVARRKSSSSVPRKSLPAGGTAPNEPKPQQSNTAKYDTLGYEFMLERLGSYMRTALVKVTDASSKLCDKLLSTEQTVPGNTVFRDDLIVEACESLRGKNEALTVRRISPLICPSPLDIKLHDGKDYSHLDESVNEGWNCAIPFISPRPQPDHSVGFDRFAFSDSQLQKLTPFVGDIPDQYTSYFMGTGRMYFPFLTCEVKSGSSALEVADRQNAHSMTVAVRGVIELFKYVKREKELDREILGFSISHDNLCASIYGHYASITEDGIKYWRHPLSAVVIIKQAGKERWIPYKFVKNLYATWVPLHLARIRSAIDDLPSGIDFGITEVSLLTTTASEAQDSAAIDALVTSHPNSESQSSQTGSKPKKPRLTGNVILKEELQRVRKESEDFREETKLESQRERQESHRQRLETKLEGERQKEQMKQDYERQRQDSERQHQEMKQDYERQRQDRERQHQEVKQQMERLEEQNRGLMQLLQKL